MGFEFKNLFGKVKDAQPTNSKVENAGGMTTAKANEILAENTKEKPKTIKEFMENATEIEKKAISFMTKSPGYLQMARDPKKLELFMNTVKRFVEDPKTIMSTARYNKDKTGFEIHQGFRVN